MSRALLIPALLLSCTEVSLQQTIECPADEASVYYEDRDGDGFGVLESTLIACQPPEGASEVPGDCDDTDPAIHPMADETCDGVDANCDGAVTTGDGPTPWYPDADGDGFGDASSTAVEACEAPAGHVSDASDCNDDAPAIHPAAPEQCDDIDWDCDGASDTQAGEPNPCGVLLVDPDALYGVDLVQEEALAAGAAAYEKRSSLPTSLTRYDLVILYLYTQALSVEQVELLADYHRGGGKLVLASEWSGFSATAVANTQAVLDALAYQTRLLDASLDATCDGWVAEATSTHRLTADAATVAYGFSGDLALGSDAVGLYKGLSGQWLVAVENGLVIATDGQILDPCPDEDDSGNRAFVRNLVTWSR